MSDDDAEQAYVAFVRQMLDDMAAGRDHSAEHYVRLFPACAERIREELPSEDGAAAAPPSTPSADTLAQGGPSPPDTQRLPERVGAYAITGELPSGGMGRLLLGHDPGHPDLKLVIKTAKAGSAAHHEHAVARLKREATILGRLDHDRICPVLDVIALNDQVFVVMPFIDGETLEARVQRARERMLGGARHATAWNAIGDARNSRSGLQAILTLLEDVAIALHAAHDQGIVHRDLKPGNILVRPDGRPVVLDFGLAVDLSDTEGRRLTAYGDVLGTPSYMAPEQIQGDLAAIDRRTDVYALGAILYELLTLRRAFKAAGSNALTQRILSGHVDPPRQVNPAISRDLEAVCLKAMAMRPKRRYPTALALAEDLRRVRSLEASEARPLSAVARLLRRVGWRPGPG